ncbi:MAG TPA: class I SAM-dependent methyltransferase [Gemmatimonadaceae bacterium]|nr:class I SAM-dependent methyltransferase [Gemmatimonadaceae bacterium]
MSHIDRSDADAIAANAEAAMRSAEFYDTLWKDGGSAPDEDDLIRLAFILDSMRRLPLSADARILDLGCGSGWMTPHLAKFGRVTALDFLPRAMGRAQEQYGDHATFALATPESPGLSREARAAFDVVVCSEVLEHVPAPSALLDQAASYLKGGGWCLLTTPNGNVWPEYRRRFEGRLQPLENWLTPTALRELLRDAELEPVLHEGRVSPSLTLAGSRLLQHRAAARLFEALGLGRWYGRAVLPTALYQVVVARKMRG